jgi:nucleoside-diphosphate-sugar epimerase
VTGRPVLAITGATGFIGQALVQAALAEGWQPRILVRRFPRDCLVPGQSIEVVPGDLNDPGALRELLAGATAVIHLAGLIKALQAADFFTANAGGTERLLQAAAEANPAAALVHVSSLAAREPRLSPYAASKQASEDKVRELAGGRPWAIIRPPAVYGPGDPATLPLFLAAHRGLLPYPAATKARVSLIHVADLARLLLATAEALRAGTLASGRLAEIDDGQPGGYSWQDMLAGLAAAAGHPVRSWRMPRGLLVVPALVNDLICRLRRRPDVFGYAKLGELYHPDWVTTPSDLPLIVHWQPHFHLENGFGDAFAWYREHSFSV